MLHWNLKNPLIKKSTMILTGEKSYFDTVIGDFKFFILDSMKIFFTPLPSSECALCG